MEYSVVIPVFNSEKSLPELLDRVIKAFSGITDAYEVILVDDHSVDQSWSVLSELTKATTKNVTAIRLSRNFGQHNATACGILESKGKVIITIDDDLEHPPEVIPDLLKEFEEKKLDILYAIGTGKYRSWFRRFSSSMVKKITRWSSRSFGDGSGFRVINRNVAEKIQDHREPFIFLDEVLGWYTQNIGAIPVEFQKRKYETSNYGNSNLFALHKNILVNYRGVFLLRMMIYFGILEILVSVFFVITRVLNIQVIDVTNNTIATMVITLFSSGLLMISIGYVGEYIGQFFRVIHNEPQFNIKDKVHADQ